MIVLDTHTLIWWVDMPQKLSKKARQAIEKEVSQEGGILISSITTFEIYMLVKKGTLELATHPDIWLEKVESLSSVRFISVDNKVASLSVNLATFSHKDPVDRMIVATSILHGAPLVTSDEKILRYPHVQSIW